MSPQRTPWPHAPTHQLNRAGTFFVTAGTYLKEHHFRGAERLAVLHRGLLTVARDFGWRLEAWSVFSNHYHFIGHSPGADAPSDARKISVKSAVTAMRQTSDMSETTAAGMTATAGATSLSSMLRTLHVKTGEWVNKLDKTQGRQVWFNYRETRLTFQQSYLARLNYVHQNAVHHRVVAVANQYPWCSAAWFERTANASMVKSIYRFKVDSLRGNDDFEPAPEW